LFGPLAFLLTAFQIAPVATAYGNETDVIELLSTGRIKTSATWCYKKPGPERCAVTLHIKDGSLVLDGVGCGSFRVPVNGSNGRRTAKIAGNTITVSVTGGSGTNVNTYDLSTDLTQCSHAVQCPAGFQARVFSCSVERNTPTQPNAQQGSSAKATLKQDDLVVPAESAPIGAQIAHTRRVDAQSYMEAAKDLRERDPDYNSLSAATQLFRKAAAGFRVAGDVSRAQSASEEAQKLESDLKSWDPVAGPGESQKQCAIFRGSAFQCYMRATRLQPFSSSEPIQVGRGRAFLDCVTSYCTAMQKANCPMPVFGKENVGFCFTTATDDPDLVQQKTSTPR
jgi:hypothetical protein